MSVPTGDPEARQRLSRPDWRFIAICLTAAILAIAIVARYFDSAFPEAAIEFRVDRASSKPVAERFAIAQGNRLEGKKHAVRFDGDEQGRIFLERSLGLKRASETMRGGVRFWYWHHRWFEPLVEEEISVDVAPTGEIVGYTRRIPEAQKIAEPAAVTPPTAFLAGLGVDTNDLTLTGTSVRRLPGRVQRIYTFESKSIRPAGAPYRHTVTLDGGTVTGYTQQLKVPDAWIRGYRELRSKNAAAGSIDLIFNIVLLIGATAVFAVRLRRGDLPLRFVLGIGIATVILVGGVALNSVPEQLAWYDTTTSYPAFLAQIGISSLLQSVGMAMLLIVICGAGEVLHRERLPQHLAIPRLWTRRSLESKRVFLSLILGYALVPMFMAYQAVFYLAAQKFGAWAPAEVPYDDTLNSALPWVAVLFAGFFPAFSEEFLSRAFAVPFLQRFLRSRWAAIVAAAFIWGFGHSTYPNQPFWIRGVEVGIAGIAAGLTVERFGLLPLLVWHYTIDAFYTAALLFASGNRYYIVSTALASLLFLVPLAVSAVLYVRRRGFLPDDDLTNAAMPLSPAPQLELPPAGPAALPDPMPLRRTAVIACAAAVAIAAGAILLRVPSTDDALDYRIGREDAKTVAKAHMETVMPGSSARFSRVIATPVPGFRSWDPESAREDGGAPGDFDSIAASYLLRNGMSVRELAGVFRSGVEAGDWSVRFFTPRQKEEVFVEVDPRTSRAVGFHRYVDEGAAGASIAQGVAESIATRALPRYGIDPASFTLKEALTFPQPHRRDWLLHYEERKALAAEAHRRVTIRVAGNEITHVAKTIRIPESVYHQESRQTIWNVVLLVMKIVGVVTLLALSISGLVIATRAHGLPWRRALRWTALLSLVPLVSIASQLESTLFRYQTSVAWDTFLISLVTSFVRDAGLQIGVIFLALAGLEAALPWALDGISREGRKRFGRGAAVAALTAVAVLSLVTSLSTIATAAFPARAAVSIGVPADVATPWPALSVSLRGLLAAVAVSAGAALYTTALRKHVAIVTLAALFCAAVDPLSTPAQAPLSIVLAALFSLAVWVTARYVLGRNPLAWPLAAFLALTLSHAAVLFQNHRPDLLVNGVALVIVAAIALIWISVSASFSGGR